MKKLKCKYCKTNTTKEICDECLNHILLLQKHNKITVKQAEQQYMSIWNTKTKHKKNKKNKEKQHEYSKYSMYLKSNKWNNIKDLLLKKHKYKKYCFCCNSKDDIHIHHKTYKNTYNENLNELVYLCSDCHSKVHNIIRIAQTAENTKFTLLKCHVTFKEFCIRYGTPEKAYKHLIDLINSRKKNNEQKLENT